MAMKPPAPVDPDSTLTTYTVVFDEGPMGINLEDANMRYGFNGAAIRAIKGQAKTGGLVQLGDVVYAANGVVVLHQPYLEVMDVMRHTPSPRVLTLVPKNRIGDVKHERQRSPLDPCELKSERTFPPTWKAMLNSILNDQSFYYDNTAFAKLVEQNAKEIIHKGHVYIYADDDMGWEARDVVVRALSIEWMESATSASTVVNFVDPHCEIGLLEVSSIVETEHLTAVHVLEVHVGNRRVAIACTSAAEKMEWMNALKLAIHTAKIVHCTWSKLHVRVESATNIVPVGNTMNAFCDVRIHQKILKTSVVTNEHSPVWTERDWLSFPDLLDDDQSVTVRLLNSLGESSIQVLGSLTIPLASLPNMEEVKGTYPLTMVDGTLGVEIVVSLRYENKVKAAKEEQFHLLQEKLNRMEEKLARLSMQDDASKESNMSPDMQERLKDLLYKTCQVSCTPCISHESATQQVQEITARLTEISNESDDTDESVRDEYQQLTKKLAKYYSMMLLSSKFHEDQDDMAHEWDEEHNVDNTNALKAIRRCMPVWIKNLSEVELQSTQTPNGKVMSREMARKFKRTNVLELLRIDPHDILMSSPSLLESLRVTSLTLAERRALYVHLRDIAEVWKAGQHDADTKRKYEWYKTLERTLKQLVNAYKRHIEMYGPVDNHPYATAEHPDIGCPLVGKQCPIKADMGPAYEEDLGYPESDVFMVSCLAVCPGLEILRGSSCCRPFPKKLYPRSNVLKKHYKNVRRAAEANGACDLIDWSLKMLENRQLEWFKSRLHLPDPNTDATINEELTSFTELVHKVRLDMQKLVERCGSSLTLQSQCNSNETATSDGGKVVETSVPDPRSSLECTLAILLCDSIEDCFAGMETRIAKASNLSMKPHLQTTMNTIRKLIVTLKETSTATLKTLKQTVPSKCIGHEFKTQTDLVELARKKLEDEALEQRQREEMEEQRQRLQAVMHQLQSTTSAKSTTVLPRSPSADVPLSRCPQASPVSLPPLGHVEIRVCDLVVDEATKLLHGDKIMSSHGISSKVSRGVWRRLLRFLKRLWRATLRRLE